MPFYRCTKFEIKILSLTEVIVFTRNGLLTYIHTHTYIHIHTYNPQGQHLVEGQWAGPGGA